MNRPAAVAGLAALAVVLMSAWGLAARDLAGDELNMLHGNPVQILQWSLDPRGGFVGHLPWSFWLRWGSLSLFGETPAWAWRLHAVAGGALAAAITGWSASRTLGLGAGLLAASLVVLDPVLAFHTQDASNYAWSAAVGAGMLAGLLELSDGHRRGAILLGMALLLGALNDFYSVLIAAPALAASILISRRASLRRPILRAWLTPLAIVLPVVALFVVRLMSATGEAVVDVHADPIPPRPLPAVLDAPWRVARRVLGAHLHGYDGGRDDSGWIGGPPVLLALAAVVLTLRGRAWPAAVLVGGALILHGLLGIGLQLGAERMLPYEPRSLIGLTPALAVMLAALTTRARVGVAVAGIWLLGAGLSTLQARLLPADLRLQAIAAAAAQLESGDALVVPDARTRSRLPQPLAERATTCLDPTATAAVWIATHTAQAPPHCSEASALVVRSRTPFDAPVHEGSAASFLPRRIVARLGPPHQPTAAGEAPRQLHLQHRVLDGLSSVRWELADHTGQLIMRTPTLAAIALPTTTTTTQAPTLLSAFSETRSAAPLHPLFSAHHNRIQSWEIDALDPRPLVRGIPLGAPAVTSLRRLLPVLGLCFAVLLALPRRTR